MFMTDISNRAKPSFPLATDLISELFSNGALGIHYQWVRFSTWVETHLPYLCLSNIFLHRNQCEMLIVNLLLFFSFIFWQAALLPWHMKLLVIFFSFGKKCSGWPYNIMSKSGHFWEWNNPSLIMTGITGKCPRQTRTCKSSYLDFISRATWNCDFGFSGYFDSLQLKYIPISRPELLSQHMRGGKRLPTLLSFIHKFSSYTC